MIPQRLLLVVPARAGSTGIHRKVHRLVGGTPLIAHAVDAALVGAQHAVADLKEKHNIDCDALVVLTSNDPQVLARGHLTRRQIREDRHDVTVIRDMRDADVRFEVLRRVPSAATPDAPVTAALDDVLEKLRLVGEEPFDVCGILQPTSLLDWVTVTDACTTMLSSDIDSMATMRRFHGFIWSQGVPMILDRVNRQLADERWIETGGLQLTRNYPRKDGWYGDAAPQIGGNHHPIPVGGVEAIDIDTPADLLAAQVAVERAHICLVTTGDELIGSGHLHRTAAIADELALRHSVCVYAADTPDEFRRLLSPNLCDPDTVDEITDELIDLDPDAIVLDVLDDNRWSRLLDHFGQRVTRLECDDAACGAGVHVGALRSPLSLQTLAGPEWFDLRDEFRGVDNGRLLDGPVLVSFGGTDPAGRTVPVANTLSLLGVQVRVIPPPLSGRYDQDDLLPSVQVASNPVMVEEMMNCSLLVTSRGRTAWEAAHLGIPAVCIPANDREATMNEVPASAVSVDDPTMLGPVVLALLADEDQLGQRGDLAAQEVDGFGLERITDLINRLAIERLRHHRRSRLYGSNDDET